MALQEEARKAEIAAAVARGELSPDVLAEDLEELPDATEEILAEDAGRFSPRHMPAWTLRFCANGERGGMAGGFLPQGGGGDDHSWPACMTAPNPATRARHTRTHTHTRAYTGLDEDDDGFVAPEEEEEDAGQWQERIVEINRVTKVRLCLGRGVSGLWGSTCSHAVPIRCAVFSVGSGAHEQLQRLDCLGLVARGLQQQGGSPAAWLRSTCV